MRSLGAILLVLAAVALPSAGSAQQHQQRLYRWKDENGVVHYGDKIPPEYANRDRDVLNRQGVDIGFETMGDNPARANEILGKELRGEAPAPGEDPEAEDAAEELARRHAAGATGT